MKLTVILAGAVLLAQNAQAQTAQTQTAQHPPGHSITSSGDVSTDADEAAVKDVLSRFLHDQK